jgi:hypothetical protein
MVSQEYKNIGAGSEGAGIPAVLYGLGMCSLLVLEKLHHVAPLYLLNNLTDQMD